MIPVGNPSSNLARSAEGLRTSKDGQQQEGGPWQREMERAQVAAWLSHGVVGGAKNTQASAAQLPAAPKAASGVAGGDAGIGGRRASSPVPMGNTVSTPKRVPPSPADPATAQLSTMQAYPLALENSSQREPTVGDASTAEDLQPTSLPRDTMRPPVFTTARPTPDVQSTALDLVLPLDPSRPFTFLAGGPEGAAPPDLQAQSSVSRRPPHPERGSGARQPVRLHAEWTPEGVHLWLALDAGVLAHQEAIAQQVRRWVVAQGGRVLSLSCNARALGAGEDGEAAGAENSTDLDIQMKEKAWPSVR